MEFRLLRADEINIRVNDCRNVKYGDNEFVRATYLLYKDARCDMNILDETVGCFNWQKKYTRDNANCIVSIWDDEKKQWIEKEDTGTESFSEAAKGLASDSFKRVCFNWGIGRELYSAPNIVISLDEKEYHTKKDEKTGKDKYIPTLNLSVKEIVYENKVITKLIIVDSKGDVRFEYNPRNKETKKASKVETKQESKQEPKQETKIDDPIKEYDRLYKELLGLGYDFGFDDRVKQFVEKQSGITFGEQWIFEDESKENQVKVLIAMQKMLNAAKQKKGQ